MKTGMVRRIDELGRIVIPKEIRRNLKLNMGDIVEIYVEDNKILLKRSSTLLGLEEDLFNIAKVINEQTNATILFVDHDQIIVCYGRRSEIYLDQSIDSALYHKINLNDFNRYKNIYLIPNTIEERTIYISPLITKNSTKGLLIVIENEHALSQSDLESIKQFQKFIIKQLDK